MGCSLNMPSHRYGTTLLAWHRGYDVLNLDCISLSATSRSCHRRCKETHATEQRFFLVDGSEMLLGRDARYRLRQTSDDSLSPPQYKGRSYQGQLALAHSYVTMDAWRWRPIAGRLQTRISIPAPGFWLVKWRRLLLRKLSLQKAFQSYRDRTCPDADCGQRLADRGIMNRQHASARWALRPPPWHDITPARVAEAISSGPLPHATPSYQKLRTFLSCTLPPCARRPIRDPLLTCVIRPKRPISSVIAQHDGCWSVLRPLRKARHRPQPQRQADLPCTEPCLHYHRDGLQRRTAHGYH
jgi:hypothetical protein